MDRIFMQILAVAFFSLPSLSAAATNTSPTPPSTTSSSSFPTITDSEQTGQLVGGVGAASGGADGGASGSGGGAFTLSAGAIAGIAVACGLVVIAISKHIKS
jgi:hypothetical protein